MATFNLKVALLGDGAVGKTSLRKRFMGKGFSGQHNMTIGADFATINKEIGGDTAIYQIWDLAGQKSFQAIRGRFYKGVYGGLVVYDVTRPESFNSIPKWIEELWRHNGIGKVPVIILGNKSDLRDKNSVPIVKGQEYATKMTQAMGNEFSVEYRDTSAKTGENVDDAFEILGRQVMNFMKSKYGT